VSITLGQIAKALAHPLVVAIASALLSLMLVTLLTKRWQDRQKELEIKSRLVTEMTRTISEPIASSRIWSRGVQLGTGMPSYAETLHQIDIKQAELSALLQVYFPDNPNLSARWRTFSGALNYCVRITAQDEPTRKTAHVEKVREFVCRDGKPPDLDWEFLGRAQWNDGFGPEFERIYEALTDWMLQYGNTIVHDVLVAKIERVGK
jgi:hypothetical protein